MRNLKKILATGMAMLFFTGVLAGCTKTAAQETTVKDKDFLKEEFLSNVNSKHIEDVDGIEPQNILETEGNIFISASYPIVSNSEIISADIKSFVDKQLADFKEEVSSTEQNDVYEYLLTYKPYANGNLLSVKFSKNSYTGKIDRKNYVDAFIYNIVDGSKLSLTDFFDENTDFLKTISDLSKEYLMKNEVVVQSMDEALFQKGTEPNIQNFSNFVVCQDKVIFYFNKNTVAPADVGTLEVSIPLTSLEGMIRPEMAALMAAQAVPEGEVAPEASPGATISTDLPEMLIPGANDMKPFSIEGLDLNDKFIALTFDDGPSVNTPRLLKVLEQGNAVATFFVVGERIPEYPDILKATYDAGHEIANHSYNHKYYTKAGTDYMAEVGDTNDAVEKVTGERTIIGRPPGGLINDDVVKDIGRIQVLWNVDTRDWESRNAEKIIKEALGQASDGSVILMHDLYATTVDACETVVPELAKQGYKFVTISQMIQIAKARGQEIKYIFNNSVGANSANTKNSEPQTTPEPYGDVAA